MTSIFVRFLAFAILVHELLYVFRDGTVYLTRCFLPTFGLKLSPFIHAVMHLLLMVICVALMGNPGSNVLLLVCLGVFMVVVASYSLRLSNHFVLIGFLLILLCVGQLWVPIQQMDSFISMGVRGLLVMTYFFAFFHKCNSDYFSPLRSSAAQLIEFQCFDRGITNSRLLVVAKLIAIYSTLAIEGLLAVMLLVPSKVVLLSAIGIGICFHFVLALAGILNFSSVMYACLIALLPEEAFWAATAFVREVNSVISTLIIFSCVLLVWLLTPRLAGVQCPYVLRLPAWIVQILFGVLTAIILIGVSGMLRYPPAIDLQWSTFNQSLQFPIGVIWLLFLLNGLSPYLGIKTEFSFAMFSNLRHEPWNHLFFHRSWRLLDCSDYVRIRSIEGLPEKEKLESGSIAELARHVFSHAEEFTFSRRFLFEGLREITSVLPLSQMRVTYIGKDEQEQFIEFGNGVIPSLEPPPLPFNLFPFLMPVELSRPHSEQGCVLSQKGNRRLF